MPITPSDIEHKTFSTALRGYDLDEVDDFLDEIVVALRDLHGELTAAKAKIAELEQSKGPEPAAVAAVATGVGDEASVGRVLILAQQAADRTLDEARAEADRLLEEARGEADRTLTEARTEADSFEADRDERRAAAEHEMAELTVLVASVRNQLAMLATSVADKLDEMDSTIESSDLVGEDGHSEDVAPAAVDDGEEIELALEEVIDDVDTDEEQTADLTAVEDEFAEVEDLDAAIGETDDLDGGIDETDDLDGGIDEAEELDLAAESDAVVVDEGAIEDVEADGLDATTDEVTGEMTDEVTGEVTEELTDQADEAESAD